METDRLELLLSRADAATPPPPARDGMADQVRNRVASSRRRTQVIIACLMASACGAVVLRLSPPRQQLTNALPGRPSEIRDADWRAEFAQLDRTAEFHEKVARNLERIENRDRHLRELQRQLATAPDPLASIEQARDRAALIMLRDGDRSLAKPNQQARAFENYRRAVQLFPDTPAAREAVQRLKAAGV
jgi:hypothetical protein